MHLEKTAALKTREGFRSVWACRLTWTGR